MKALIQRVLTAHVTVDGQIIGQIQTGVLGYIGIGRDDNGKMGKSVSDVGGGLLLVSQFTLMAQTNKGRRPDFAPAMPPDEARVLFDKMVAYAKSAYPNVATGQFGANMTVMAVNDGPINFLLEV